MVHLSEIASLSEGDLIGVHGLVAKGGVGIHAAYLRGDVTATRGSRLRAV
jgi:hypothetical protein